MPALSSAPPIASQLLTVDEMVEQSALDHGNEIQASAITPLSVVELLRQRKVAQRKKAGIEFTNLNTSADSTTKQPKHALIEKPDDTPADIKQVIERFAPQTGQISEATDKHM